jgi:multidrug resistance efflux pump
MKRKLLILVCIVALFGAGMYFIVGRGGSEIILTGIVTTDQVIVSSEIQGRLQEIFVKEGSIVTNGQLLGVIQPQEWKAEMAFYANTEEQSAAQVAQAEADLKFQEAQTSNQIQQAEATLASAEADVVRGQADLENATLNFNRMQDLYKKGVEPIQSYDQARTSQESARARVESLQKQVQAAQAAVGVARANRDQVAAREAALQATKHQFAAAAAQRERAKVRLDYTQIRAPIDGIVDVRAALQGEVVNAGQAILTLINPDNLWVRADVEETYIDRVRLGDKMTVRLPSGVEREGTVTYRGFAGEFATQRDVSRTKRDIRTFEIRLRCDNQDRRLAVGMTAFVTLPLRNR